MSTNSVSESSPLTVTVTRHDGKDAHTIAVLTLNPGTEGKPAVFGPVGLRNLDTAIDAVAAGILAGGIHGVVVVGSGRTFCAGADLDFMAATPTRDDAIDFAQTGHRVFGRLRDLKVPVVAAINGTALGGGLELALHCSGRVVADTARNIGLPEVSLGLLPGWGGTTLLPRLIGMTSALAVLIANPLRGNKLLDAREAHHLGIVDEVCGEDELLTTAIALASREATPRTPVELSDDDRQQLSLSVDSYRNKPANPIQALEAMDRVVSGTMGLVAGFSLEVEALADLIMTTEFRNRVYSFHLTTQRARNPAGIPRSTPKEIVQVGVVGAGLMASQFVSLFAERLGVTVVMTDVSQERLDVGVARITAGLEARVAKGQLTRELRDAILERISPTLDYSDFATCDFVMEAVFEDFGVKKRVLAEVEKFVSADAIIATNTSSLSVEALAKTLTNPSRFIGFHFFNPVAVMPLIEIVASTQSDDTTVATASSVASQLRKSPVLVRDQPGFVVNRVLSAYLSAVCVLVESGVTPAAISRALEPLRLPMTPFALVDLIGRTVTLHMLESLHAFAPDRISVAGFLRDLEQARGGSTLEDDINGLELPEGNRTGAEIRHEVEDAIAIEISTMLDESVVPAVDDIDLCLINGAAWPVASGGISRYLDESGASRRHRGALFHSPAE